MPSTISEFTTCPECEEPYPDNHHCPECGSCYSGEEEETVCNDCTEGAKEETPIESEVIAYEKFNFSEAVMERMLDELFEEYDREPTAKEMGDALDNRADGHQ